MHDEPSSQTPGESTITEILQKITFQFKTGGIASPRLDAELLLAFVLNLHRLDLYLQADRPLTTIESGEMFELAKRGWMVFLWPTFLSKKKSGLLI